MSSGSSRVSDLDSQTPITGYLPAPVLLTRRLELRQIRLGHGPELTDLYVRNKEHFGKYQPAWDATTSEDMTWTDQLCDSAVQDAEMGVRNQYAVRRRSNTEPNLNPIMGHIYVKLPYIEETDDYAYDRREIGYLFDEKAQGRGYAREALGAVAYATLTTVGPPCEKVFLTCDPENEGSARMAITAGFIEADFDYFKDGHPFSRSGWMATYELPRELCEERVAHDLRPVAPPGMESQSTNSRTLCGLPWD
jgi:RimJ/RimL family protein N-acetyltransferase